MQSPSFIWSNALYMAVGLLLLALRWETVGMLSIPCFLGVYGAVVLSMGLYPNGLFICCVPGAIYLVWAILKKWTASVSPTRAQPTL
jgi:hypothetical protein